MPNRRFFISAVLENSRLEMRVENLDDQQADKIRPKSDRGGVPAGYDHLAASGVNAVLMRRLRIPNLPFANI